LELGPEGLKGLFKEGTSSFPNGIYWGGLVFPWKPWIGTLGKLIKG